jgi:hypothetical protein
MMRQLSLLVVLVSAVSCQSGGTSSQPATPAPQPAPQQTPPPQTAPPTGAAGAAGVAAAPVDTNPERNPTVQAQLRAIAGRENEPAGQVFKNIQVLKTVPAGTFIRMMGGFARATGGRCSTCHVAGDWPAETKPQKQVARQMVQLVEQVNTRLKSIQGLQGPDPHVGCYTCHRGMAKPAP